MKIIERIEIERILPSLDLMTIIADGFIAYSDRRVEIPPVGEMSFQNPPGDVHIKYGYIKGGDYYVIKIASGFYNNPQIGLPSSMGMMLLFNQKTGQLFSTLLDDGLLTQVRTAIAGAISAKYLANKDIEYIGIVGTGTQAKIQLRYLKNVTDCRNVVVWGIEETDTYKNLMQAEGFSVQIAKTTTELAKICSLIVTTTPSREPLLWHKDIQPGTHITAVGADTAYKQELDSTILAHADLVVADSIAQCQHRGEIYKAITAQNLATESLLELGNIVSGKIKGRTSPDQITVADLTGVAVQDLQISKAVYEAIMNK
jgi:ornithine cyclodeaminase